MLPNIESMNNTASTGGAQTARHETDRIAEAYKTANNRSVSEKGATSASQRLQRVGEKAADADRDHAAVNFALSREERDAFISAFSGKQDPATMSEAEQDALKTASERITKFIDEAIAHNAEKREQVEKAVGEWYSRLSRGDRQEPMELVSLLRAAAIGDFDKMFGG